MSETGFSLLFLAPRNHCLAAGPGVEAKANGLILGVPLLAKGNTLPLGMQISGKNEVASPR